MGSKFKKKKNNSVKSTLRARLSFDQGYAENPIYSIKANTNEKNRGIDMIDLIKNNFRINREDLDIATKKKFEEWQKDSETPTEYSKEALKHQKKIVWTRDEKGNPVSPWELKRRESKDKVHK